MSIFWSSPATGLCLTVATMGALGVVAPIANRPNVLRGNLGDALLTFAFLIAPVTLVYFGYRAFTDAGVWALFQIPFATLLGATLGRTSFAANAFAPFLMTAWSLFIMARLWDR